MSDKNLRVNYIFFSSSIKIFHGDLKVFAINMASVPANDLLRIMADLVAVREGIESLEREYCRLNSKS